MYSALVSQNVPADASMKPTPDLPRKVRFWNTCPSSWARPQEPGSAALGSMLITPTLPSALPPVAQAFSSVRFQVFVTMTSILYWASAPDSGVNFIVFT